jgi:hypothetical protein
MTRRDSSRSERLWLAVVLALLLCGSPGCLWCGTYPGGIYGPCATRTMDAACDSCGEACGGTCGATCGQFPASCGTFARGGCGGLSGLMLPLLSTNLACGSGCGDMYWGEWIYDPPACCDSCNEDGCWAGSSCDSSYDAWGYPCGCGLLAGPVAVIRGTYLGVSNLVACTLGTVCQGYRTSYGYPAACGCSECTGVAGPACGECGMSGCDGGCCQNVQPTSAPQLARRQVMPNGRQVRTAAATAHPTHAAQSPQHVVSQRLRR